jgi:hypothetical protein
VVQIVFGNENVKHLPGLQIASPARIFAPLFLGCSNFRESAFAAQRRNKRE